MIRAARDGDEPALAALWRACGLTIPANDPDRDIAFCRAWPNAHLLLAEDQAPGGAVIASIMAGHDGHRGWLYYVAVAPGHRRRGLGRAMVEAAEQALTAQGVWKIHLLIRETNSAVAGFYARLGYQPAPRIMMAKTF